MELGSNDIISINVKIADRPYPLKIKKSEEEEVRNAAKAVNEKIKEYRERYAVSDKQDYLAMVALMFASELISIKDKTEQKEKDHISILTNLEQSISSSLNS